MVPICEWLSQIPSHIVWKTDSVLNCRNSFPQLATFLHNSYVIISRWVDLVKGDNSWVMLRAAALTISSRTSFFHLSLIHHSQSIVLGQQLYKDLYIIKINANSQIAIVPDIQSLSAHRKCTLRSKTECSWESFCEAVLVPGKLYLFICYKL